MSVVNCRVKYIREQGYNNLKEWMNDSNNVYVRVVICKCCLYREAI